MIEFVWLSKHNKRLYGKAALSKMAYPYTPPLFFSLFLCWNVLADQVKVLVVYRPMGKSTNLSEMNGMQCVQELYISG